MKQRPLFNGLLAFVLGAIALGFGYPALSQPSSSPKVQAAHIGKTEPSQGTLSRIDWTDGKITRPARTPGLTSRRAVSVPGDVDGLFTVYLNVERPIIGYTLMNADCTFPGDPIFSVPTSPQHGTLRFGVATFNAPSGPCAGKPFPYTVAYYAWTDRVALAGTSDAFALHFSKPDGSQSMDTSWAVTLADAQQDPSATAPADTTVVAGPACPDGCSTCPKGCAVWSVAPLTVSLGVQDIPLSYRPPKGPAIDFGLYYSHRDVQQPATFTYGNFGPQWTTTWLSYVTDTVAAQSAATLYQRGGGAEPYAFGAPTGTISQPAPYSQAVLTRTVAGNGATTGFIRRLKDGSSEVFTQASSGSRFFMTAVIDPQSNRVTLSYDAQSRLVRLTDAVGRDTVFTYSTTDPLKIVRVTDPFGRFATFTYTSGRLASITDQLGLTSSFTYGPGNFINRLTTPYGATAFTFGDSTTNPALGTPASSPPLIRSEAPAGSNSMNAPPASPPALPSRRPVLPCRMRN